MNVPLPLIDGTHTAIRLVTQPTGIIIDDTRTFGIAAHIDAGKTSLTEYLLKLAGKIRKIGLVHEGNTVMDSMDQERERGITIKSAPGYFGYKGLHGNLIDTPGHVDFTIEVKRSLRVLDAVIVVLCACGGVEPQTVTNWNYADEFELPRILFVNKMDKVGANFLAVAQDVEEQFGVKPLIVQLPIGAENSFAGMIDLFYMKAFRYDRPGLKEGDFVIEEIPADMLDEAQKHREAMIERIVENDTQPNGLMERYLTDANSVDVKELKLELRKQVIARNLMPMMCGSALKQKGGELVLDGLFEYFPAPNQAKPIVGTWDDKEVTREASVDAPLAALAFKPVKTPDIGTIQFVRIYSGKMIRGERVNNATQDENERVQKIIKLLGDKREEVEVAMAGEVVAVAGMKITRTGDTICDEKHPLLLPTITFPTPVVFQAIEPKSAGDRDKMTAALVTMSIEDPSFTVRTDEETGQTVIGGQGELHLDIIIDVLKRTYKVEANVFPPEVSYRETVRKEAEGEYEHKKQSGGSGQYAEVLARVRPRPPGSGFNFVNNIKGGEIPAEFHDAVEKGFENAMKEGALAGYPVVDVEAEVWGGSFHAVDSSNIAFELAARHAFRVAFNKANPVLLEPIGRMNLFVPEEHTGAVTAELSGPRRGIIESMDVVRGRKVIKATMPMATSFGLTGALRNQTKGMVTPSLEFSHYAECPKFVQDEVIAKHNGDKTDKK
jgi:elongation factor G